MPMENRTIMKKLRNKAGFSLAELLIAILIMLMVTVIVAAGIPAARSAYLGVRRASNADVLLSTTITTLRNELGMARREDISVDSSNKTITYFNQDRGAESQIFLSDDGKSIQFKRYNKNSYAAAPLITGKAETDELNVTYATVTYDDESGIVKFEKLEVTPVSGGTPIASRDTVSIRVMTD